MDQNGQEVNLKTQLKLTLRHGEGISKTSETIALFYEAKCAVVARLSEGKARVPKPQAHESIK